MDLEIEMVPNLSPENYIRRIMTEADYILASVRQQDNWMYIPPSWTVLQQLDQSFEETELFEKV